MSKPRVNIPDFQINFYGILVLYVIALAAAYIDRWVGVVAFICMTVVLVAVLFLMNKD